ncbi:CDP-diacylglycerol--glycerol-3-phosphate 3-phosphatidyltransferase [Dokdonella koreensis]|uniref:CDP-diacylglycerol--glycerol-3-phosphate 3-phosphatidyltransferase n=1 Tax=Dokdonella koreensis DS-123 TaxID=1300342 RepID=A0A160DTF5_9GAMM|nr:CDP-diacylglycerol--glycerol-3-phosphate 3-phosphatidyltransferase [Dokdonella koreensis]ANB17474.1 CDP-diacylglycerol-glycerol-3-phosphate 3-phosphatidyltransferase [Dokdonella koreensis DS-123]
MTLTLPTILTLFRIVLLPVIVVVFYLPEYFPTTASWSNIAAAGVFVLAAVTDWLDGWIARRYDLTSAFGAFLDPVADKLMVAVALFLLVQQNPTALMAVASAVIVGREISISALREWMAEIGQRAKVGVAWIGKLKTTMQIVAIVVCLHQRDVPELRLYRIGEALLVVAAVLTIWSALVYVRAAWPALRDNDSGRV